MPIEAAPIVVDPSGDFLGDDGSWSTFLINVGAPPQELHVLASTDVAATWVIAPDGCQSGDASNCTKARGGTFDSTKSTSWKTKGMFGLLGETNLGYSGNDVNGTFGFDTLGIPGKSGVAHVSSDDLVVAAIATREFFVGNLGLSAQPVNFTDAGDSTPSFLTSLKNQNLIPSVSFGYTAGASYKQNGVTGSLTLGGYDASRFVPNDVEFTFAPNQQRRLVVGLQSVSSSDGKTETPLLTTGVLALVDSTVPYLWLPQVACKAFETTFGITWDPIHNLYLVNDTTHDTLTKSNPSVTFQLANSLNGGPSIKITLPYASFDLMASYPLMKTPSRYFPLQRAPDDVSYTLGRTFLQEAFMVVDFENSNFSISQSTYDPNTPAHIVPIIGKPGTANASSPTSTNPSNPSTASSPASSSSGISTGAIAGIAIVIVLIALICSATTYLCLRRRRRNRIPKKPELPGDPPVEFKPSDDDCADPISGLESKKLPKVTVGEVASPMTPPLSEADNNYFPVGSSRTPTELPGHIPPRSELSTPEPIHPPVELPSRDAAALRSELSTPEPLFPNSELPTQDPSHELPSPSHSRAGSGASSSTSLPNHPQHQHQHQHSRNLSGLSSPLPLQAQRPTSLRMDSTDSDSGFTHDGMRHFHRRFNSDGSKSPVWRPGSVLDSSDSGAEGGVPLQAMSPALLPRRTNTQRTDSGESAIIPRFSRMESETEGSEVEVVVSPLSEARGVRIVQGGRPVHVRSASERSESWETRLEMSSGDESGGGGGRG